MPEKYGGLGIKDVRYNAVLGAMLGFSAGKGMGF